MNSKVFKIILIISIILLLLTGLAFATEDEDSNDVSSETTLSAEDSLDDVYISEMLPAKTGWNHPFLEDTVFYWFKKV